MTLIHNRAVARRLRHILDEMGTSSLSTAARLEAITKRFDRSKVEADRRFLVALAKRLRQELAVRESTLRAQLGKVHHFQRMVVGESSRSRSRSPERLG